jgi:glycosyltransferase involved in cell wall biosynthesis
MKLLHLATVHRDTDTRVVKKEASLGPRMGCKTYVAISGPDSVVRRSDLILIRRRWHGRLARMTRGPLFVLGLIRRVGPDVIHIHEPELFFLAVLRLFGFVVILDHHEDFVAQIKVKAWIPKILRPAVAVGAGAVRAVAQALASGSIAATPEIRNQLGGGAAVVQNYPDRALIKRTVRACRPRPEEEAANRYFIYVGVLSKGRGMEALVNSVDLVDKDLRLIHVGSGPQINHPRIEQVGWLPYETMLCLAAEAVCGIVTFLPEPNHVRAQPNKLFEYLAVGIPAVYSNFDYWVELIGNGVCGLAVDPSSPECLANAINDISRWPDKRSALCKGARDMAEKFDWAVEERALRSFYGDCIPLRSRTVSS